MTAPPDTATQGEARRANAHKVFWHALLQLPERPSQEARITAISEAGLEAVVDQYVGVGATARLRMCLRDPRGSQAMFNAAGSVRVASVVFQGHSCRLNCNWIELGDDVQALLQAWLRKLGA
jgi:hypothetical protein